MQMHRGSLGPRTIWQGRRPKRKSKTNCRRPESEAKYLCLFLEAFEIRAYDLSIKMSDHMVRNDTYGVAGPSSNSIAVEGLQLELPSVVSTAAMISPLPLCPSSMKYADPGGSLVFRSAIQVTCAARSAGRMRKSTPSGEYRPVDKCMSST